MQYYLLSFTLLILNVLWSYASPIFGENVYQYRIFYWIILMYKFLLWFLLLFLFCFSHHFFIKQMLDFNGSDHLYYYLLLTSRLVLAWELKSWVPTPIWRGIGKWWLLGEEELTMLQWMAPHPCSYQQW